MRRQLWWHLLWAVFFIPFTWLHSDEPTTLGLVHLLIPSWFLTPSPRSSHDEQTVLSFWLPGIYFPACVCEVSANGRDWEQGLGWVDLLQTHLSRSTLPCGITMLHQPFWIKSWLKQWVHQWGSDLYELGTEQGLYFEPWIVEIYCPERPPHQTETLSISHVSLTKDWHESHSLRSSETVTCSDYFIAMV